MSVNICFHTIKEKRPKHHQKIIWLSQVNSFQLTGFDPREINVEYQWTELNENDEETGNSYCFDKNDLSINETMLINEWLTDLYTPSTSQKIKNKIDILFKDHIIEENTLKIKYRLDILFDGYIVEENTLWCSVEEYWKSFENHLKGI